jgi:hypothetical protein
MKNLVVTVIAISAMTGFAFAETTATVTTAPAAPAQTVTVTTIAQPTAQLASPPTPAATPAPELEKQPTVVVEASPLTVSKAEEIRNARQQTEVETEQKIVEKLEQSRMEDERKRQEAILGSFGGAVVEKKAETAPAPAAPAPVAEAPKAAPAPSMDDVRNTVKEELSNIEKAKPAKPAHTSQNYMGGIISSKDYNSSDVQTIGAVGLTFGKVFDERWDVSVGVGAAKSYVDESTFAYRQLNEFDLGFATKFNLLTGRIRPTIGAAVDYVNRNYSEARDSGTSYSVLSELNSWAIDFGLTAGLDVAVSENMLVGIEYRFMKNMTYEYSDEVLNTPAYRTSYGDWRPLEERDYDFVGLSVKYLF